MQKQLSKKSHKPTESSIDDFMKHIKKYNLQSERYISPKPLLYMYTNPSRHHTLQTLQKSRSKSKTLSNRQCSQSKKNTSKNIRLKVQKMLSLQKRQKFHKKSISQISNINDKTNRNLNKSTAQMNLTRSKQKIKNRIKDIKKQTKQKQSALKQKKGKQSKTKLQYFKPKFTQRSPLRGVQLSSQIEKTQIQEQNPAQLIQIYSKKLLNVETFLESNKNKLGSMLCRKFQQILNQIVQSLVQNLKTTLNQLQKDIQSRLKQKFQKRFDKQMMERQKSMRKMQEMCQKITKKFAESYKKNNYLTTLIYNLRLKGIDIDNQFGRSIWNTDALGGNGYKKDDDQAYYEEQNMSSNFSQNMIQKLQQNNGMLHLNLMERQQPNDQNDYDQFEFRQHPNKRKKQMESSILQRQTQAKVQELNNKKYLQQRQLKYQLNSDDRIRDVVHKKN